MILIDTTYLGFGSTGIGSVINRLIEFFEQEQIEFKTISYFDFYDIKKKTSWYKYFNIILMKEIKQLTDEDIFLFPENIAGFVHFGKYKCKSVFIIHDLFELQGLCKTLLLLKKILFARVLRNVTKIITVSECSKKIIGSFFPLLKDKIYVHYPFYIREASIKNKNQNVFFNEKSNKIIKSRRYILANGSGQDRKNAEFLIENANHIFSDFGLKIIFFGKDFYCNNYKRLNDYIDANRCRENVFHVGAISNEQLVYLYENAACFVFPSIDEGFGLPPVEALLNNCKIAVSDITIFKEILSPLNRFFSFNYESLAENLRTVIGMSEKDFITEKQEILKKFEFNNYKSIILSILFE